MKPEDDAEEIWKDASISGIEKYITGSQEHRTQFWTAGAGWYAKNLKDEQLDLISYLYHLNKRISICKSLAKMMEDEEVSLRDAAKLLKTLMSDNPPEKLSRTSND